MINLFLKELKAIAKLRKFKDYKSQSKDELIKILSKSQLKIKEIRKSFNELWDRFCKSKIK